MSSQAAVLPKLSCTKVLQAKVRLQSSVFMTFPDSKPKIQNFHNILVKFELIHLIIDLCSRDMFFFNFLTSSEWYKTDAKVQLDQIDFSSKYKAMFVNLSHHVSSTHCKLCIHDWLQIVLIRIKMYKTPININFWFYWWMTGYEFVLRKLQILISMSLFI